nr:transmembrane regulator protein PrtR [uncultured bacterium]
MTRPDDRRDHDLHALVDGLLSPERRAQVEAEVAADPAMHDESVAWRQQRELLRRLGMRASEASIPIAMLDPLRKPRRTWLGWAGGVAAAAAIGCAGWIAHALYAGHEQVADVRARFVRDAVSAHAVYVPEVRHPVEVGADQSAHLVQWLSKRLGAQLKAPDLQPKGYDLVGGRLLPGPDGARAQFMYQDASGVRVTLYVTVLNKSSAPTETSFRFSEGKPTSAFYWLDGGFGYALAGNLPRTRLLELSETVYAQLAN